MNDQHIHVVLGEHDEGGYHLCDKCGGKTMLICAGREWSVDSEPYKAGEEAPEDDDATAEGYVEIDAEVTAHYCAECSLVTSFAFNQRNRQ